MKKILLIIAFSFLTFWTFAQNGIIWENGTFQDAVKKAAKNSAGPKQVFLDCYTSWCGPCKHMAESEFTKKEAGDYFNKNFVNIKMDMEKGEGIELAKKLKVTSYPTFVIFDDKGNEVGRVGGAAEIGNFIKKVEKARDVANNPKVALEKYLSTKDISLLPAYLGPLKKNYETTEIAEFFTKYFLQIPEKERYSFLLWEYMESAISLFEPTVFNYIIDNNFVYNRYIGKEAVDKMLISIITRDLQTYLYGEKDLPKEMIEKADFIMHRACGANERFNLIVSEVAMANADNNPDEIVRLLNIQNVIFNHKIGDVVVAESILVANKLVPREAKLKFVNRFGELLDIFKRDYAVLHEKE